MVVYCLLEKISLVLALIHSPQHEALPLLVPLLVGLPLLVPLLVALPLIAYLY